MVFGVRQATFQKDGKTVFEKMIQSNAVPYAVTAIYGHMGFILGVLQPSLYKTLAAQNQAGLDVHFIFHAFQATVDIVIIISMIIYAGPAGKNQTVVAVLQIKTQAVAFTVLTPPVQAFGIGWLKADFRIFVNKTRATRRVQGIVIIFALFVTGKIDTGGVLDSKIFREFPVVITRCIESYAIATYRWS